VAWSLLGYDKIRVLVDPFVVVREPADTGTQYPSRELKMKQKFTASIWQEDEWFVAQCVEVDVASQGKTEDEALENLRDALEVHFTPPVATLAPQIRSLEIEVKAA
jgi:hypothetical protein